MSDHLIEPWDEQNQRLVNAVHPPTWVNPTPAKRYDMVVIGAGTAGLVCAAGAASRAGMWWRYVRSALTTAAAAGIQPPFARFISSLAVAGLPQPSSHAL